MKTTQDCYEALINGEVLRLNGGAARVKLKNRKLVYVENDLETIYAFSHPEEWEIEDKYESLNGKRTLCWVSNIKNQWLPVKEITRYSKEEEYRFYADSGAPYKYIKPLTKEEITEYLNNVPEWAE